MNQQIPLTLESIQKILTHPWKMPWIDFSFYHGTKTDLIIAGSHDFSYYHNLEIIADRPLNIQGHTEWSSGIDYPFIIAPQTEGNQADETIKTLQFRSDEGIALTITAESFFYNLDTVFYYKRDNLQPHQRLAYWLR